MLGRAPACVAKEDLGSLGRIPRSAVNPQLHTARSAGAVHVELVPLAPQPPSGDDEDTNHSEHVFVNLAGYVLWVNPIPTTHPAPLPQPFRRTPHAVRGLPPSPDKVRRPTTRRRALSTALLPDSNPNPSSGKLVDGPSCGVILLNSPRTGR